MQLCIDLKFKNEEKKLKRHHNELNQYEKIKTHIKECRDYNELQNHPISTIYGFEQLKYEFSGYYSFNLSKNGGVIRLICSIDKNKNCLKLEFISTNHYKDFKVKMKNRMKENKESDYDEKSKV